MHIYIRDIYIYIYIGLEVWMSSLSALSTVHMYFSLYGFLFSFRFHDERFETMRFDLRQKISSFVVVKKKKRKVLMEILWS